MLPKTPSVSLLKRVLWELVAFRPNHVADISLRLQGTGFRKLLEKGYVMSAFNRKSRLLVSNGDGMTD